MAATRIYAVTNGTEKPRLIEATSQSQALRYVAEKAFAVEIASPKTVAQLMGAGTNDRGRDEGGDVKAKALEIRDKGTFIPALAVDMNPGELPNGGYTEDELKAALDAKTAQFYLLRRCGYPCDGAPDVMLTRLDGSGITTNDPYEWDGRTFPIAHNYIIEHWHELKDGDVVDVSFILGETQQAKVSERFA